MKLRRLAALSVAFSFAGVAVAQTPVSNDPMRGPKVVKGGADLPNGWHIRPAGHEIGTMGDLVMNLSASPDHRILVAVHAGFQPHGLEVYDLKSHKQVQHIELPSAWNGLAWSPDGKTLYVAGGNHSGKRSKEERIAPVYEFSYANGRLSGKPTGTFTDPAKDENVWWSGLAMGRHTNYLYAVDRGTKAAPGNVVVFDPSTRAIVTRIPVEMTPYGAVLSEDGKRLFVSNWSSQSVSVIDTDTNKVESSIKVGMNPTEMKLSADGRLFVACSNDNTVYVIDTKTLTVIENLSTTMTPKAPEGSTPDALAIDDKRQLLYIANADNNTIAVARISNREHTSVVGFIPSGWYPSALALADGGNSLYIGNSKGERAYPDPLGPHSTKRGADGSETIKTLQVSSLELLNVADLKARMPEWTKIAAETIPYHDSLLAEARRPSAPSIIPQRVGDGSPIQHIIYIIKENRTYDQEFGDLPHANGDSSLTIFGEHVTPNQHALAKEYVTFDNLYCDGEVSFDGHSWSNSAYATDFNEKSWPSSYGGESSGDYSVRAIVPSAGHFWDLARQKGLTYRSYGENAARASTGGSMAAPGSEGLNGHVAKDYPRGLEIRDTEKIKVFLREFKEYEANFDSKDPAKRMPNYTVMSIPGDHTQGARAGAFTPTAMVADNDQAIGELVDAVSHSRYWPTTAIFIIEDDAQDGSDHVDARRTVGLVVSPYAKRGITDSTLYSTSSMVRSMELLLGLPPMSQYDAAAMPMYAAFGTTPVLTPFSVIAPQTDVMARNPRRGRAARESAHMNLSEPDHAPMHALNQIIWETVKGPDAPMPPPVHRFRPLIDASDTRDKDGD